jgi:hypothetical protein
MAMQAALEPAADEAAGKQPMQPADAVQAAAAGKLRADRKSQ